MVKNTGFRGLGLCGYGYCRCFSIFVPGVPWKDGFHRCGKYRDQLTVEYSAGGLDRSPVKTSTMK